MVELTVVAGKCKQHRCCGRRTGLLFRIRLNPTLFGAGFGLLSHPNSGLLRNRVNHAQGSGHSLSLASSGPDCFEFKGRINTRTQFKCWSIEPWV